MGLVLLLILLGVPLAELWVIIEVGEWIGVLPTLVVLIAVSVAGAWLLKREGLLTWRRLRDTLRRGRVPADEAIDGALILFGGALLLTPGFLTDAVGLLLLIPVSRAVVKRVGRRWLGRRVERRLLGDEETSPYRARVIRTSARDAASGTPRHPPPEVLEQVGRPSDDSRGTG
jgi:UPF0716 protein FxsA